MALTLLNHFYWQIPEAKIPFMIADVTIVVAMKYVEKGIAAEEKLRRMEEQHTEMKLELDKEMKLGRKQELRAQQLHQRHSNGSSKAAVTGKNSKLNNNIQQPNKRQLYGAS